MKKQLLVFLLMLLPVAAMASKKGKCGDNVTYNFDKATGTLTIEGSGPMWDYRSMFDTPWGKYYKELTRLVIKEGVTTIGNETFRQIRVLSSVEIPNSVQVIPDYAFYACYFLKDVKLPNNVKKIGVSAFSKTALKSIVIPDGVTEIGERAFYDCNNLTSVTLPSTITKIHGYTFGDCRDLEAIYVASKNTNFDREAFTDGFGKRANPKIIYGDQPLLAQTASKPAEVKKPQAASQQKKATTQPKAEPQQKTVPQRITPQPQQELMANVDQNIPATGKNDKYTFAVVIGNEKYDSEAPVPFAENDARVFKEYVNKTLGVPENQIRYIPNATLNKLRIAVRWLAQAMEVFDGQGRAIFYYAGHGIPNEKTQSAYLLPVDGIGSDPESAYPLDRLYEELGKVQTERITVFLDACFSGAKREGDMMASARGVAIKAKRSEPKGKMVVFSAAQGDETAYPFKSQRHGMFTYYLLRRLQETKGDATLGDLGDYLRKEVKRRSFVENNKVQTPSINASDALSATWRTMKLK